MKALNLPEDPDYDDIEDWDPFDHGTVRKHGIYLYEGGDGIYMAGMDIAEDIAEDKRLSEMKDRLQKLFKKIGVDVDTKDMKFEYGEIGSG
jgi:hypothetical protein